jgi:hypothetical protein
MRTKTLLLTAALCAAGVATSMAQVYSQNAVGYINLSILPGFNLVANQLTQANVTLEALIPSPPDQTIFYSFSHTTGYSVYTYDLSGVGGWDPAGGQFVLGKGGFLYNPTGSPFTVTLVGEVPQGTLLNPVEGPGFDLRSSKVPQSGLLQTDLQYSPLDQEQIYKFSNATGYSVYTYDLSGVGGWDPAEPSVAVGEAFFISTPASHGWTRIFSVN